MNDPEVAGEILLPKLHVQLLDAERLYMEEARSYIDDPVYSDDLDTACTMFGQAFSDFIQRSLTLGDYSPRENVSFAIDRLISADQRRVERLNAYTQSETFQTICPDHKLDKFEELSTNDYGYSGSNDCSKNRFIEIACGLFFDGLLHDTHRLKSLAPKLTKSPKDYDSVDLDSDLYDLYNNLLNKEEEFIRKSKKLYDQEGVTIREITRAAIECTNAFTYFFGRSISTSNGDYGMANQVEWAAMILKRSDEKRVMRLNKAIGDGTFFEEAGVSFDPENCLAYLESEHGITDLFDEEVEIDELIMKVTDLYSSWLVTDTKFVVRAALDAS